MTDFFYYSMAHSYHCYDSARVAINYGCMLLISPEQLQHRKARPKLNSTIFTKIDRDVMNTKIGFNETFNRIYIC